ncbi:DUF3344 domain-containing protein [Streptomyces sp. KR80]|uniref:DUF3344 domain-containing protein n=1 Tax=Streptomyces sp. KR80 TaxID=3457426 RepID=UPI003FD46CE5
MRVTLGRTGQGVLCAVSSAAVALALPQTVAVPAIREAPKITLTERFRAVQRGGIVRAANSSVTCQSAVRRQAPSCEGAQDGRAGTNSDYRMTYIDVDKDRNTYNSSRAELRLPKNATVSYARLYWGANLRVGEQKPPGDSGRVLFAEPGGEYKEVVADTTIGHHLDHGVDAFAASADVTHIVRDSKPGDYTVAQVNVAQGHTGDGAWGGWTLVVAYEDRNAPLRQLGIWDGFETMSSQRREYSVALDGLSVPPGGSGSLGVVAYDGDRGEGTNTLGVGSDRAAPVRLSDAANPPDDAMNSTISDHGKPASGRRPSYANTLGLDSDVYDLRPALTQGAGRLTVTFGTAEERYHLGALFLQADTAR